MKLNNHRGMTIAEMTVGMAIGAILLLAVVNVMSYLRINTQKATIMTESRIANSLGDRFLWLHLKSAEPSFNNLRGPQFLDDNGQNFYDLLPDADIGSLNATQKTRTYTLKFDGKTTFSILTVNALDRDLSKGLSPTFFADPTKFYDNIAPGSVSSAGSGPFADMGLLTNYISQQNPNILNAKNKVVEIFSPITIRPAGLPTSSPPIAVSYFLRFVGDKTFVTENFGGVVSYVNAADGSTVLNNFDDFLKTLPSSGGGIPPVMIRSIRFIQYELHKDTTLKNPVNQLRFKTWDGAQFTNPVLIATDIESIVLSRKDVRDPLISVKINMVKKEVKR